MMWWDGGFGIGMIISSLIGIAVLVGLVFLIVWAIKRLPAQPGVSRSDPLEIARERYAKGEISQEEFQQIKKNLA